MRAADDFAAHLLKLLPDDVDEVINTLVAKRTKRPVTADELIEAMRGSFPAAEGGNEALSRWSRSVQLTRWMSPGFQVLSNHASSGP